MRTDGEGPSPLGRWDQRSPANAQAVHGEGTVELEKWEQTLHGCPWRTTKGAAPCAVKVARTVLNGEREETYRNATRFALTQLPRSRYSPRLKRSVDMTSDVKSGEQLFCVCLMFFLLGLSEEPEPVNTTVDLADIRGLATTLLASVGCLPHSRDERTLWPLNAAEGYTKPGLRLVL